MERTLFEKLMSRWHLFIVVVCFVGAGACGDSGNMPCPDTNCADYATQQQAQAAFDADPECRGDLDADNDGAACEQHFPGPGNGGCPTTSNCGCSGKNMSECRGVCCQWVVGTGCRCG